MHNRDALGNVVDVVNCTAPNTEGETEDAMLTVEIKDAIVGFFGLPGEAEGGDTFVNQNKLGDGTDAGEGDSLGVRTFVSRVFDNIAYPGSRATTVPNGATNVLASALAIHWT